MMNMDVGFTAVYITCKHKEVINACGAQALYCANNDFQEFL